MIVNDGNDDETCCSENDAAMPTVYGSSNSNSNSNSKDAVTTATKYHYNDAKTCENSMDTTTDEDNYNSTYDDEGSAAQCRVTEACMAHEDSYLDMIIDDNDARDTNRTSTDMNGQQMYEEEVDMNSDHSEDTAAIEVIEVIEAVAAKETAATTVAECEDDEETDALTATEAIQDTVTTATTTTGTTIRLGDPQAIIRRILGNKRFNDSTKYVINNFPLFGFINEENAIFQCLKELIDNSVDAVCRRSNEIVPGESITSTIYITIGSMDDSPDSIFVMVRDKGSGIVNPTKCLSVFNTTADSLNTSCGRFGIGLSVCFIYSFCKVYNSTIRIITKTETSPASCTDLSLNNNGTPVAVVTYDLSSYDIPEAKEAGTTIRVLLPYPSCEQPKYRCIRRVTDAVVDYIQRINALPSYNITFELDVNVESRGSEISFTLQETVIPTAAAWLSIMKSTAASDASSNDEENMDDAADDATVDEHDDEVTTSTCSESRKKLWLNTPSSGIVQGAHKKDVYCHLSKIAKCSEDDIVCVSYYSKTLRMVSVAVTSVLVKYQNNYHLQNQRSRNAGSVDDDIDDDIDDDNSNDETGVIDTVTAGITNTNTGNAALPVATANVGMEDYAREEAEYGNGTTTVASGTNDAKSDGSLETKVRVIRFINSTPLLDIDNCGTSCAITKALKDVNWREFGMKMDQSLVNAPDSPLAFQCPNIRLMNMKNESEYTELTGNNRYELVLLINAITNEPAFGNLRKVSLLSIADLSHCAEFAVMNAVKIIRKSLEDTDDQYLLMSTRDWITWKLFHSYIGQAARSLTTILQNTNISEALLIKLDLPISSGTDDIANRFDELIRHAVARTSGSK